MGKIKLGARPKSFKSIVKVALPGDESGTIEIDYKYRTQTEAAEYFALGFDDAKVRAKSFTDDDQDRSFARALEAARTKNADQIMDIAVGWNLDDEFNRANVERLCDELPGVAVAIIDFYRNASIQGRLGN
jgi:hypothetical protein